MTICRARIVATGLLSSFTSLAMAADWHLPSTSDLQMNITVAGNHRSCLLHLPTGYDVTRPLPLMILLHGGKMTGAQQDHYSNTTEMADRVGCIIAYPDGVPMGWTKESGAMPEHPPQASWQAHLNTEEDDIEFLSALLDEIPRQCAVDQHHIMVAGGSAGALMSYRAGIELAPRITAIGSVAGSLVSSLRNGEPPAPRKPAAALSVIAIHGLADKAVAYDGFRSPTALCWPCEKSVAWWAEQNGCGAFTDIKTGKIMVRTYPAGRDGAVVKLIAIDDFPHGWPALDNSGLDASVALWEFLMRDEPCHIPRYLGFLDSTTIALKPTADLPSDAKLVCTLDGSAPKCDGTAPEQVSLTDNATVRVAAFRNGQRWGSEITTTARRLTFRPADHPQATQPGLHWDFMPGDWTAAANAIGTAPSSTGSCALPDPTVAPLEHHYALVFIGYLSIPADGLYTISAMSDDGSVVDIGGERVVSCDGAHAEHSRSGFAALSAGLHAVRIGYFEAEGGRALSLSLSTAGGATRQLGANDFVRDQ